MKELVPYVLGIVALLFTLMLVAIFREPIKHQKTVVYVQVEDEAFTLWKLHVKHWEGKLTDDSLTNMGVTFSTYRLLSEAIGLDPAYAAFVTMTEEQHNSILYYHWKAVGADTMKDKRVGAFLAEELWASGTLYHYGTERNYEVLLALKRNKYKALCSTYPKYCKGWHRRLEDFEQTINLLK